MRDCTVKDAPTWHLIEFNAVRRGTLERVVFTGATASEAFQPDNAGSSGQFPWFGPYDGTKCSDIVVRDCSFANAFAGIGSHSAPPVDGLRVVGCTFTTSYGIRAMVSYQNFVLENCTFNGCVYAFVAVADGFKVIGNHVNASSGADLNFTGCVNGVVENNTITTVRSGITNLAASVISRHNLLDGVLSPADSTITVPFTAESLAKHALAHDGTAARVTFNSVPAHGTYDFYLSAWFYPFALADNTFIIGRDGSSPAPGVRLSAAGGITLRAIAVADIVSAPAGSVSTGAWHFIEVWRASGVSSIAVNGTTLAIGADATDYTVGNTGLGTATATAPNGLLARAKALNFVPTAAQRLRLLRQLGALPVEWRGGTMTAVTAGSFVTGTRYVIATTGTGTTFPGAVASTPGTVFTATGAGSGTGTAFPAGALWALDDADLSASDTLADRSTRLVVDRRFKHGVRPYTVREFARLQGVPDSFQFAGTDNQAYRQIGNGVSEPVGYWLGRELRRYFGK